jgi:DNA-3-methyladenine glycosylase II
LLVRAIVGQQVSVRAASTIMGRIASRLGQTVAGPNEGPSEGAPMLLFPSASKVADGDLDAIGMPARRVAALKNVARMIAEKAIPFPDSDGDASGVKEALLALPGIGPWTVEYFALRALRESDAWPGTDLALRRSIAHHPSARTMSARSVTDAWRPYRAYAAMYLWHQSMLSSLNLM